MSNVLQKRQEGVILIVTLWVLAILVVFATGVGIKTLLELKLIKNQLDRMKVYYLAKAGIQKAILLLRMDKDASVDTIMQCGFTLQETETQAQLFYDSRLREGTFDVSYTDDEGRKFFGPQDEDRFININLVKEDILRSLVPDELKNDLPRNIRAWRGDKDIPIQDVSVDYDDYAYECKRAPFNIVDELLLVKDMPSGLFYGTASSQDTTLDIRDEGFAIKDIVTVYGDGKVNLNTAPKKVIEVLGLGKWADAIIEFRNGQDNDIRTEFDNGIFHNNNEVIQYLTSAEGGGLTPVEVAYINEILNKRFKFRSDFFRIRSTGIIGKGRYTRSKSIVVVVKRVLLPAPPHTVEIVGWYEE